MAILVTGGAGYIGSHTCVELLNAGEDNSVNEIRRVRQSLKAAAQHKKAPEESK